MDRKRSLLIINGRLMHSDKLEKSEVLIENGIIERIGETRRDRSQMEFRIIDAQGLYLSPGFIDLQVNGGAGFNFEGGSCEEVRKIIAFHVAHGTTGLLPTAVTASIETVRAAIRSVKEANHPAVLGVHIEGPFISTKQKGAHNPQYILKPTIKEFERLVKGYEDFIKIVTLAPELAGAEELIARIKEIDAIPSLGHSDATYTEAIKALDHGVALFTHLFNAMREFHHREPGAVGAAFESDAMVELIADGVHVHPAAIRLLLKAIGIERICLITDSISASGLGDGKYSLGGLEVLVKDGEANLGDGTLAGSTLTVNRAVKNFMKFTGVSLPEAVRTASLNPAILLGMDERKGSIEEGKDADIIIFDEKLTIHYTIIGGEPVYSRNESNHHK